MAETGLCHSNGVFEGTSERLRKESHAGLTLLDHADQGLPELTCHRISGVAPETIYANRRRLFGLRNPIAPQAIAIGGVIDLE
jgi:hypothetical protein